MIGRVLVMITMLAAAPMGAAAGNAPKEQAQDPFFGFLNGVLTLPFNATTTLFGPADTQDLTTRYRRRGFTQKDQDYFQLQWYADQRMGYDELHEYKELEEEIQRETYGPNR